MCGDLDENNEFGAALQARFRSHAQDLLAKAGASRAASPVHAGLDKLFADALNRAVRDQEGAGEDGAYETMALQPLVFARLAGFLAAHAALQEDPLRRVIEALMHGYAEAERMRPSHDHHHHDDHHGHDHHHH